MLRLWNLLIWGECHASKWEKIREVEIFWDHKSDIPSTIYEVQRNQYGRVRRVRI
jgi:hypothetical protein